MKLSKEQIRKNEIEKFKKMRKQTKKHIKILKMELQKVIYEKRENILIKYLNERINELKQDLKEYKKRLKK